MADYEATTRGMPIHTLNYGLYADDQATTFGMQFTLRTMVFCALCRQIKSEYVTGLIKHGIQKHGNMCNRQGVQLHVNSKQL